MSSHTTSSNPKAMSVNTSYGGSSLKTPSPEQPAYHKRTDSVQTGAYPQHQTPQHSYASNYPVYPPMWQHPISSASEQQPVTSASSPAHSMYYARKSDSMNSLSSHVRQPSQPQMSQPQTAQGQWGNAYGYQQTGMYTPISESSEKTSKRRRSPEQDEQAATYAKRQRQDSIQSNAMHSRQASQAQYTAHPMSAGIPATTSTQQSMPAARSHMQFTGQYANDNSTAVGGSGTESVPRFYTSYPSSQAMQSGVPSYSQSMPMQQGYGYAQYASSLPADAAATASAAKPDDSVAAHEEVAGTVIDESGQTQPPGHKMKVSATLWEDEHTLCYQVEARGISVARREDNGMINGTKLLNVSGMTRGRRDGILKAEKNRRVVKIGPMHLKGVW